ncbi:glycoside hydrolase family 2 protein, partial [Dyadobacter sp.]|uniref:glycoside hydrolase family 2 protein n=1 Tax=Dyadobacter sp. TaxID=1914288 RepID=UPI003F70510A
MHASSAAFEHLNLVEMQNHTNYGSSKSREASFDTEAFRDDLPRAVLRPNEYILLDGEWKFAVDAEDRGLVESWYVQHDFTRTANWPGSVEQHLAVSQNASASWQDKIVVWYERSFEVPAQAAAASDNDTILQLTFGACGYATMVWLNGHLLSTIEGDQVHTGEYTSFSYELEMLKPVNRLTVRVASSMDADIPRGKQESHVYKRGGIWYQTFTGAVRSVWLEKVERNRLRSRVGVVSIIEDNLVRFTLTTRIHDPGKYKIKLFIYPVESEELVAEDEFELVLEAGQKSQRLVVDLPNALLWSVETPNLYRLVAQLIDEEGSVSEIETKFGLRKFEARGNKLYLNSKPIYLDGILYQPGNSTYDQIKKHLLAMKELGCNLVRIHIAGVDPRIYKLADKIGILLWVEVPSPHQSTFQSRENHRAELRRMVALIGTHPSVVIWSLYNEDWGVQDIAHNVETQQYIIEMYHFMQIAYPQFLVVDNDGWQHISLEGRLKSE